MYYREIKMKINEVAKLANISRRTLHYYDKINLLSPSRKTENGYRIYSRQDLELLQQIMFFKELDFTLADIKKLSRLRSIAKVIH